MYVINVVMYVFALLYFFCAQTSFDGGLCSCCSNLECNGFTLFFHCGTGERVYEQDFELQRSLERLSRFDRRNLGFR